MANTDIRVLNAARMEKLNKICVANDERAQKLADAKEHERLACIGIINSFIKKAEGLNAMVQAYFKASSVKPYEFTFKVGDSRWDKNEMRWLDIGRSDEVEFVKGITLSTDGSNMYTLGDDGLYSQFVAGCKSSTRKYDADSLSYIKAVLLAKGLIAFEEKLYNAVDNL